MNKNEKQESDKIAAHALLDAARDGADIPQADIDAALALTGDRPADAGFWGWAMAGVGA